jgi:hypothetical protein
MEWAICATKLPQADEDKERKNLLGIFYLKKDWVKWDWKMQEANCLSWRKGEKVEQQEGGEEENGNVLGEPELKMAALEVQIQTNDNFGNIHFKIINFQVRNRVLSESLANVKEENEALGEKLREAEEKAQMVFFRLFSSKDILICQ